MKFRSILIASGVLLVAACTDNAYEDKTVAQEASSPSASAPASTDSGSSTPAAAPYTSETAAAEASAPADTAMPASVAATTGRVDSIDTTSGSISIAHDAVDGLDWPAKTQSFKATPEQLQSVQAGDDVTFVFDSAGSQASLVSITTHDSTAEAESD